ncbi:MAG: helix-turn-helix transcriptional regulator [Phycisphaeraceae bacterium]
MGSQAVADPPANLPERLTVPEPAYARAVLGRLDRLREDVPHTSQSVLRGLGRRRANRLLTELLIELEQASAPVDAASTLTDPVDLAVLTLGRRISVHPGRATSVSAMAAELGLGRDAFARRFEAIHRDKPQRFIVHQRIRLASQLLAETYQPIKQIAAQLGYRDTHYFSRQFKQWTGQTPHAFRCGEQSNPLRRD